MSDARFGSTRIVGTQGVGKMSGWADAQTADVARLRRTAQRLFGASRVHVDATDSRVVKAFRRPVKVAAPQPELRHFDLLTTFVLRLSNVSMHLPAGWREEIFAELQYLIDYESWDPDDTLPSLESFGQLLKFIIYARSRDVPRLAVSNGGNLVGVWANDSTRLLLEFFAAGEILWSYAARSAAGVEVATGRSPLSMTLHRLAGFEPEQWFKNA